MRRCQISAKHYEHRMPASSKHAHPVIHQNNLRGNTVRARALTIRQGISRRTGIFWACQEAGNCLRDLGVLGSSPQRPLTAVALTETVKHWVFDQLFHMPARHVISSIAHKVWHTSTSGADKTRPDAT